MAHSPLVNFIVAGVQKGGTTALFDYLSEDPRLALSFEKEVHFFDDETRDWSSAAYDDYHARFPAPDGRLRGEATPIYLYWPGSLERIRAYNPEVKLVVLLRDPVERAWSHWRMEYARGVERQPFAWCIREGRQRLFDAEPWGHHREFSYVERGFYGEQVERLFGLFRPEQVLLLRSDQLREAPGEALGAVYRFLELEGPAAVEPRTVHEGARIAYPSQLTADDVRRLRDVYRRDQDRLERLTGLRFF